MKRLIHFVAFLVICNTLLFAQDVPQKLEEVDKLSLSFDHKGSLKILESLNKENPNNWEILWRISREKVYIGNLISDNEKKEAAYLEAQDYATKAIKLAPDKSITYLRRAIASGKVALFKGVFSVGEIVNKTNEDVEKAIKLGNGGNYIQGIAHYVKARTHSKVSEKMKLARDIIGLGWADLDIAIAEFQKAEKLHPNFPMIYFDWAEAEIKKENYRKAKELLEKVISLPVADEEDPMRKKEAKKLLAEVNNEL